MRIQHLDTPLATVEAFTITSPTEPVGTLSLPVRDHLNAATVASLLGTDWRFLGDRTLDRSILQGSVLTLQRNEAVQRMRGDWLLFVDDDMTWQPDAIGTLVASYLEVKEQIEGPIIMGGLCVGRTPPHRPTLYMREDPHAGAFNYLEDWTSDVVEVDATGMAFCIIGRDVFEAMMGGPMPSKEDRVRLPPWEFFYWRGSMGEDLRFCVDARAKGARVFVDTRVHTGHIGEKAFGMEDFWAQVAVRGQEIEDARRDVNDRMQLPTLSMTTARERLGW